MRKLLLASIAGCMLAGSAQAVTLAESSTDTTGFDNRYVGQSFTIDGTGVFNEIVYSFFQGSKGAGISGNLYIFGSQYSGTPEGLSTSTALASAAGTNGIFSFGSNFKIIGGQQYFAYSDGLAPLIGGDANNPYAGGQAYLAFRGGSNFQALPNFDLHFSVTGTAVVPVLVPPVAAVPEPATWAMMIVGFGLVGGTMRRRKTAVATRVRFA